MTAAPVPVTFDARLSVSDAAMAQELGGEIVILDLASEQYFGLNAVGARVWELLVRKQDVRSIHKTLCDEFDAAPIQIERDLLALLQRLTDAGLVKAT